ncbi:unnamed protein product [Blepharisma stoltei]|uniref:Uncharacterized protein n=1 Tax=Blepharisma stoltei TaxID=1481888 RepID=A0AAU9K828_9CILI|nr:unnamed protein product [Blepharisma stoltei]
MICSLFFSFIVILISWAAYFLIDFFDIIVTVKLHDHEKCKMHAIPLAAEDFELYGNLVISAIGDIKTYYYKHLSASNSTRGSLFYFDPASKTWGSIPMSKFPSDIPFNPHGIFLLDNSTLYVLNHAYGNYGERIEIFGLLETKKERIKARYIRSIVFPQDWLGKLNDIAVLKDGHFYVSEWMPFPDELEGRDHSLWTTLKRDYYLIMTKSTNLYYCKESKGGHPECTIQDTEGNFNGMHLSNNQLFVDEAVQKIVKIYDIKEDFSLTYNATVKFQHHVDNIDKQNDGSFLVTGFSKIIEYMKISWDYKHGDIRSSIAGGVSRMANNNGSWIVEDIITQDKIFASSAVIINGTLIIGSPTDNFLLLCPTKY